ncbi:MAG: LuxR C-terminal-related transcriptional regulator [Gammaproteobacteria bacterium]|nr:LuxR C-terminal-related transcriptional regulator [Gammaproteobacteria bacterium]
MIEQQKYSIMAKIISDTDLVSHISFLACPDVEEICRPLFIYTPVKVFEYSRVYSDGSRAELSNHAEHMRNAFITRAKMSRVYTPSLIKTDQSYLFVPSWIENMRHPAQKTLRSQLYSQHELFKIGNELSIIKRHADYVEYFHFFAESDSPGIENFYLNNMELLEQFVFYFTNTARHLISKADADRLLKPWRDKESEVTSIKDSQDSMFIFDKKAFSKSINPKRFFLRVNEREVYLTRREMDCASLLVQGKMNRAISKELFISHRTVETHIESLKTKTNCRDRDELIKFLLASGFHQYI